MKKLSTISKVCEILGLIDPKTNKPLNYILRYWEKEFDTLTPVKRTGNRRYYTQNDILTILKIHNLISTQGFTVEGAKQKLDNISRTFGDGPKLFSLLASFTILLKPNSFKTSSIFLPGS